MGLLRFLIIFTALWCASTVYAVDSCKAIFESSDRGGYTKYAVANVRAHTSSKLIPYLEAHGTHYNQASSKWSKEFPTGENLVYRGMTVTNKELKNIKKDGLKIDESTSEYGGYYVHMDPNIALAYLLSPYFVANERSLNKPMGVLIVISAHGLSFDGQSFKGNRAGLITQSVSPEHIHSIYIFDPEADPLGFPFVQIQ